MRLDIHDSLATLKRDYSGFWLWIHLLALALFLSPYLAFIMRAELATAITKAALRLDSANSSPLLPGEAKSLGTELWNYIWTAGQGGVDFRWMSLLFVFGTVYNGLRGALLYKTHTLALEQDIKRGLPLAFVLEHKKWWWRAYRAAKFLFWFNVVVAVLHFGLALAEPVVLTPEIPQGVADDWLRRLWHALP